MARHLAVSNPSAKAVTIACLLGLGEDYGAASRDWTYGQLGRHIDDAKGAFRNFSDPQTLNFPGGFGRRPAWRFDFADRTLLTNNSTLQSPPDTASTLRLAGRALATASAIPKLPEVLRRLNGLSRRTIGGTAWWAGIVATDTGHRATAIGNGQSHGTAAVTAIAADRLARSDHVGARYLWDLIDAKELQAELAPLGVLVTTGQEAGSVRSGEGTKR